MVEDLKKAVEVLKQRIRFNLDLIHKNEDKIKIILKEPVSKDRSRRLDEHFRINKKMIKENNEALKLQKEIMRYVETFHNDIVEFPQPTMSSTEINSFNAGNTRIEIKREDYLELTINKEIEFDSKHPYFNDPEFLNDLLEHYIDIEDYEMCAYLTEVNKSQHTS